MTPHELIERAARLDAAYGDDVLADLIMLARDRIAAQWAATAPDDVAGREALYMQQRALDTVKTAFQAALADGARVKALLEAKQKITL